MQNIPTFLSNVSTTRPTIGLTEWVQFAFVILVNQKKMEGVKDK